MLIHPIWFESRPVLVSIPGYQNRHRYYETSTGITSHCKMSPMLNSVKCTDLLRYSYNLNLSRWIDFHCIKIKIFIMLICIHTYMHALKMFNWNLFVHIICNQISSGLLYV